jgi:predicted AlkP superfamily phosphohydrolase/phosphomutase
MRLFKEAGHGDKKALIIGIDGVPCTLIQAYLDRGYMPHLKEIIEQGHTLHQMNASIPDISSVSWTTFATGVNPAEHGIYGFTALRPHTYSLTFPNATDVQAPPFWNILGQIEKGQVSTFAERYGNKIAKPLRTIILNIPHTYPAYPVNGILISGFVAIDLQKAIFPPSIHDYLQGIDYRIDVDAQKAHHDKDAFLQDLFDCFDTRKEAVRHFFQNEPWDLFIACVTETDRLQHFFIDAALDQGHPYHGAFERFYRELDAFIGTMVEDFRKRYGEDGFVMILSDHGFTTITQEVYLNKFLQEAGFLNLSPEGQFYERIGDGTRAFAMDPGRIYLNYKDRYPRGCVDNKEGDGLLEKITESLRSLESPEGTPVIDRIVTQEEIYHGPLADQAPDLVCLPQDGYDLKGKLNSEAVFGRTVFTGMHTWHDALCIAPPEVTWEEKPWIGDLAEVIMRYFIDEQKTR